MPSNVTLVGGEETTDEICLNFLNYYPAVEATAFAACGSFENGLAVGRLQGFGQLQALGNSPQFGALADMSFAFGPGDGLDSLVLNFEGDPSKNIAACCETNSCEEAHLEVLGGECASDGDCKGDLACSGRFCVELEVSGSSEPDVENTGMAEKSSGKSVGLVVSLVGTLSNVLLLFTNV